MGIWSLDPTLVIAAYRQPAVWRWKPSGYRSQNASPTSGSGKNGARSLPTLWCRVGVICVLGAMSAEYQCIFIKCSTRQPVISIALIEEIMETWFQKLSRYGVCKFCYCSSFSSEILRENGMWITSTLRKHLTINIPQPPSLLLGGV